MRWHYTNYCLMNSQSIKTQFKNTWAWVCIDKNVDLHTQMCKLRADRKDVYPVCMSHAYKLSHTYIHTLQVESNQNFEVILTWGCCPGNLVFEEEKSCQGSRKKRLENHLELNQWHIYGAAFRQHHYTANTFLVFVCKIGAGAVQTVHCSCCWWDLKCHFS